VRIAVSVVRDTDNLWRRVTAIRSADIDDNPNAVGDPNWLPEGRHDHSRPILSWRACGDRRGRRERGEDRAPSRSDRVRRHIGSDVRRAPLVQQPVRRRRGGLAEPYLCGNTRFDEARGQRLGHDVADSVLDHVLTRSGRVATRATAADSNDRR
jgi:hypothetical protein